MARSPHTPFFALIFLLLCEYATAKTVTYDFNVSWVNVNPDGLAERRVIGINGQWPLPVIEVDKGDRLVVNMYNGLGDKNTSLHFHGMFQTNSSYMDGPSMITQCPIPPGYSFTYDFTINQNGTYWYHCHTDFCYPDGYRQALIVHDRDAYFSSQYQEEFIITLTDWYHDLVEDIRFLSLYNPTGAEPVPNSFLFNDTQNVSLSVKPSTTYLVHFLNVGAFVGQYIYIEDHNFTIVEIDGVYTEPTEADLLYISAAQRYTVLLTTKNSTDKNYPIVTVVDSQLLDSIPNDLQLNSSNWLEYNASADHPQAIMKVDTSKELTPYDDLTLIPYDGIKLLPEPDHEITLTVVMGLLNNGFGYAFFDNVSFTFPKVPTLYTVMSAGKLATNEMIYGEYTHPIVLKRNEVVQIVLNNNDNGAHPFHLHGHNFQVIHRDPPYGADFFKYKGQDYVPYNSSDHAAFPPVPSRRDVSVVPPKGHYVIRFVADNPGVWMFHCHIDWHLEQGLALVMIEAPEDIQETHKIPQQQYDICRAAGVPVEGNAAANTKDFLDLSGQNRQKPSLPSGFTARGIVALVFSCISAVLGMAFITMYGLSEPKLIQKDAPNGDERSTIPGSSARDIVEPKVDRAQS
ncbi:ferroxidase fet3 [Knufia peltigerae]|uniref:Ferroxidase fet3 n=1 Tax=Knufia peltigerae TaxID=1002370 RepID=A0AA38Y5C8_9EURO|nr:ferroxidase fet3 [Knufia peltigerae]